MKWLFGHVMLHCEWTKLNDQVHNSNIQESCSTMLNSDEGRPEISVVRGFQNPERWRDEFTDKITRNQGASDGITSQDIRGPLP